MGRPHRIDIPGVWYHVLNRGVARQTIFFDDRDRVEFERLLGIAHERFGLVVHSYCLMTNHYHLLVELPDGGLSESMHLLGSTFVRHVNERQGRDGPLFRSRFAAKPVADDDYAIRLVRYIHRNPLAFLDAAGLRRYRWSSLRTFLGDRTRPTWMSLDRVLDLVGGIEGFDRLVLGTDDNAAPPLDVRLWPDVIDLVVDSAIDESSRQSAARTLTILLLDHIDQGRRSELASLLDFPTPQAERSARSRARRRVRDHTEFQRAVSEVLQLVA